MRIGYTLSAITLAVVAIVGFYKPALALDLFYPGSAYNPINVNVVLTQQQLNQQKAATLQSTYGITAYNSCRSWCQNTSAYADPQVEASCLTQVEACLRLKNTTQNPQCSTGYVLQNGSCVSGCQIKYGSAAYWTGNMSNGTYVCDCASGYVWNAEKTACIVKTTLTCPDQNNSYLGNDNLCYCRSGLVWNQSKNLCVTPTLTCPSGQTPSNGQCITYDTGCKTAYGQYSIWSGSFADNGSYICGCVNGYKWDSGSTACIVEQRQCQTGQYDDGTQCVSYDDTCRKEYGLHSLWTGKFETDGRFICGCMDRYNWSTDNKSCVLTDSTVTSDPVLTKRMLGYILLQIESHGEAWYVNPKDSLRYYMKDGATAYGMMRSFGLGITDLNLKRIPIAGTTDEIKNASNICTYNSLANSLKGKILLQVQQHGEAYYVYPKNCRMIYMKDGEAAYQIMRYLGLGIANNDLTKIPTNQ